MSIRWKLLLPVLLALLVTAVGMLVLTLTSQQKNLQRDLDHRFGTKQEEILGSIRSVEETALAQASTFSRHERILQAYEEAQLGNPNDPADPTVQTAREMLKAWMEPFQQGYVEQTGSSRGLRIHYHFPNGRSFLRVWRGSQTASDDISSFRKTVLKVNRPPYSPVTGIEVGRGGFAIRGLAPVAKGRVHYGSVEMLYSFGEVTNRVKTSETEHFAVYMNRDLLEIATSLRDPAKYPHVKNFVRISSSDAQLTDEMVHGEFLASALQEGQAAMAMGGWELRAFTIPDYQGDPVGVFVLLLDISEQQAAFRSAAITQGALIIGLMLLILGVLHVASKRILGPVREAADAARAIARGRVDTEISYNSGDELGEMSDAFRTMQETLKAKAEAAQGIREGQLETEIPVASDEDLLGNAMTGMRDTLKTLIHRIHATVEEQIAGDLDARCADDSLEGAYRDLAGNLNEALEAVTTPMREVSDLLEEYARGDLSRQMRELPGKQIVLTQSLQAIRKNLEKLIEEGGKLSSAAREGQLHIRGEEGLFSGGYASIIQGMNATLAHVQQPLTTMIESLERLARGDLTATIESVHAGEYRRMTEALNQGLAGLNELLLQIFESVDQVNAGADQVAAASQTLSQGATEQASSLQQINASMSELAGSTRQNADLATTVSKLSLQTRKEAQSGNEHMNDMLEAMERINESSDQISKIIKTIDEIAFQTNLLALNAAVEAARAGVHGKGFAVVAEEVRNLAQRSAKAARETTELIDDTVTRIEDGSSVAQNTAKSLSAIVERIEKIEQEVGSIAQSSRNQAEGIGQVNEALTQVETVTQANSASSEQSAAAAEELASQASKVVELLKQFQLREQASQLAGGQPRRIDQGRTPGPGPSTQQDSSREQRRHTDRRGGDGSGRNNSEISPGDVLDLSEEDFGDF